MPQIKVTLTEEQYRDLWISATHRQFNGKNRVNTFIVVAAFGYCAKYPLKDAQRDKYEAIYQNEVKGAKAVQPQQPEGKSGLDGEAEQA